MKPNNLVITVNNSLDFFRRNIRLILIAFSILAFVIFYLFSVKLLKNDNIFFTVIEDSEFINEGDFIFVENEKVGKITKIGISASKENQIFSKLAFERNVNIPDKSYLKINVDHNKKLEQLNLILVASSGYYKKHDTIPFKHEGMRIRKKSIIKSTVETKSDKLTIDNSQNQKNDSLVSMSLIKDEKENLISFKVQFLVSNVRIPLESKKFKDIKNVTFYMDKGQYKYITGNTNLLSESVKYCEEIKKAGFPDAFVIAFNGDKRISVKEAQQLLKN